jgi:hypothetical protein
MIQRTKSRLNNLRKILYLLEKNSLPTDPDDLMLLEDAVEECEVDRVRTILTRGATSVWRSLAVKYRIPYYTSFNREELIAKVELYRERSEHHAKLRKDDVRKQTKLLADYDNDLSMLADILKTDVDDAFRRYNNVD